MDTGQGQTPARYAAAEPANITRPTTNRPTVGQDTAGTGSSGRGIRVMRSAVALNGAGGDPSRAGRAPD